VKTEEEIRAVPAVGTTVNGKWGDEPTNRSSIHGLWALTNRELKKWYKAPVLLIMSLIQPIVWLGLFGKAMNFGAIFTGGSFNIPGLNIPKSVLDSLSATMMQSTFGTSDYFSFLAVGMIAFVCLFTAMFSGMSIVWDRRFGFLDKVLSTPVSRGTIIMGKVFSSVLRSLAQALIVLLIAVPLGMDVGSITVGGIAGTFVAMFLMTLGFSALFIMLALRSTDWQSQMAIMNLLNLPLLFGSNALFPSKLMPSWLQTFVKVNPISYATDAARQMLLGSTGMASLGFDFAYLLGFAVLFSAIGIVMSWKLLTK
jgi:ABC-2 type transport system permease protein